MHSRHFFHVSVCVCLCVQAFKLLLEDVKIYVRMDLSLILGLMIKDL